MSPAIGKCQKIRHIVRIRQMLKQWRRKARTSAQEPSDVPPGHVVVIVGASQRRYLVRATHLNHPIFRRLLLEAEEEYGFSHVGPLTIPCDESLFEEILRVLTRPESAQPGVPLTLGDLRRCCHVGMTKNLELFAESRPLIPKFAEKQPVC